MPAILPRVKSPPRMAAGRFSPGWTVKFYFTGSTASGIEYHAFALHGAPFRMRVTRRESKRQTARLQKGHLGSIARIAEAPARFRGHRPVRTKVRSRWPLS